MRNAARYIVDYFSGDRRMAVEELIFAAARAGELKGTLGFAYAKAKQVIGCFAAGMTDRLIALGTAVPGDDLLAALNKATRALQFHSNAVISTSYCYGRTIDERHDMLIERTNLANTVVSLREKLKSWAPTKLQSVLEGQFFYCEYLPMQQVCCAGLSTSQRGGPLRGWCVYSPALRGGRH
jgi:hypothetical protein